MIDRLGSYLASRPKRAAVVVLTLIVVLALVLAGLALELSHFGRAPYPSEKVPFSLVDGYAVFTMDQSWISSPGGFNLFNYTGMKVAFRIDWGGGSGTVSGPFGNQSQLSTHTRATTSQSIFISSFVNVSLEITDSTGDGSFDLNDTILFKIVPLSEDTVYTMGLLFVSDVGNRMTMEMSFAFHDGKLYAWNSHDLNTEEPWFGSTVIQTPTSSITTSTVTGGEKFTFAPMSKDTPWSDVSILLSDGSTTCTWTPLTTDLDNGTVAKWNHFATSANLGTLKVNISIADLAGNGYVNQGDYFTLTLGSGQVFSIATTYAVIVMHDPSSAAICHLDFQGEAEITPTSSLTKSTVLNGLKLTFAPISKDTPWSDVSILLTDGSNSYTWTPLTTDLDNGTVSRWNHIAAVANLGTLKVNISIVDLAGNGYVNTGDYFALTLGSGQLFSVVTAYTVTIMHDPSSAEICHISFMG